MRSLAIFVVVLLLIIGVAFAFLILTTPSESAAKRFPPALVREVPDSAEWFAIIPGAAALDAKLKANPVTRAAIEKWRATQPLPRPWMLGGADLLAWKSGQSMHYFVRLDPFRAFVVRTFTTSTAITINVPPPDPINVDAATQIVDLAGKLPPGDALVVQRENARGSFPPIGRPAVTSVQVSPTEIRLTSVSVGPALAGPDRLKPVLHFPRSAVLSVAFKTPPRILTDLNRLFGTKISDLFADGGMLCIYDVDVRTFLPRPIGVLVLPDTPQRRAEVGSIAHTASKDGNLLVSFDRSIEQYQKDVFDPAATAGNQWTARIDAPRLVPILNSLDKNLGLRIVAPRIYRSARDLKGWLGGLEQAKVIDASDSVDATAETLQVRIAAK